MAELSDRGDSGAGISPRALAIAVSVLAMFMFVAESYRWLVLHRPLSLASLYMPSIAINLWSSVPARGEARRSLTLPWFVGLAVYYLVLTAIALVVKDWFFLALAIFSLGAAIIRLYTD